MRRVALPLCLLVTACPGETTPSTDETTGAETSTTATTNPMTAGESSSSESSSTSAEVTTDDTLDPTTESSSSTDPTIAPETTGEPSVCGDGMVTGNEACDGTEFDGNTCQTQGFMEGTLVCSPDCLGFSTVNCFICGDNEIQGTEECDGPLDNSIDCESLGFTEGAITCDMSTCQYDVSGCTLCGDGVAEGDEFCDMADLFGEDCASLGFDGGTLACNNETCGYDYTLCSGGQYLQDFEGGDIPPEFESPDVAWGINSTAPISGSYDARSGDIGDNGVSTMTLDVVFSIDGTVDFMHREDTESCCDFLEFYVDGAYMDGWSGVNAEANASYPITSGPHTLEWRYTKDFSVSTANDSVWIDDLALFGGVPTG